MEDLNPDCESEVENSDLLEWYLMLLDYLLEYDLFTDIDAETFKLVEDLASSLPEPNDREALGEKPELNQTNGCFGSFTTEGKPPGANGSLENLVEPVDPKYKFKAAGFKKKRRTKEQIRKDEEEKKKDT